MAQALAAPTFTWPVAACGAALLCFVREFRVRLLDLMNGYAVGVMVAARFSSLLNPAVEIPEGGPLPSWIPATAGLLLSGIVLWAIHMVLTQLYLGLDHEGPEGAPAMWQRPR